MCLVSTISYKLNRPACSLPSRGFSQSGKPDHPKHRDYRKWEVSGQKKEDSYVSLSPSDYRHTEKKKRQLKTGETKRKSRNSEAVLLSYKTLNNLRTKSSLPFSSLQAAQALRLNVIPFVEGGEGNHPWCLFVGLMWVWNQRL